MSDKEQIDVLESKLHDLEREYIQKIRKLKKHTRAAEARAYVQKRVKEEAEQTGTCVRLQASSCQKQTSKSTRALKHNHSKERRKSTSSLKYDDSAAWHQKTSRLESEDLKPGHQMVNVLKHEDSSVKHKSSNSSLKPIRLCGFGLSVSENKEVDKQRHSRKNQKCEIIGAETLTHQHEKNDIVSTKSSDSITQANSEQAIETIHSASNIGQKQNLKIQDELNLSSENVKLIKDIDGLKIDSVQKDAAYESSEDIFTSTPKEVNCKTCEGIDLFHDSDSDQVIIVPSHEDLVRNKENFRCKNQLSKLKLSKYKKKNFVNPVRVENMVVEKENMITAEDAPGQVPAGVQKEFNCSGKCDVINIEKEVSQLKIGKESFSQSNRNVGANSSAQGTAFSEGQVIVFERQLRKTDKEDGVFKCSEKCSGVKSDKKSPENSVTQSSIESSISSVCDNKLGEGIEENTKIRRRSGSRKRRSSGLEAQRRSSRIAGHSSQESWSQSTETENISQVFVAACESAAKKRVIISSVFQCLVDEGKRRSNIEEFNIPADVLESGIKTRKVSNRPDTDFNTNYNSPIHKAHCSELEIKEEIIVNEDQKSVKTELLDESIKIKSKLVELPTTETYDVNFLEKDDVISPTLFESQPNNSNIFSFSKEIINDKVNDFKSMNMENDLLTEENSLMNNGNGKLNKGNEQVVKQNVHLNKGDELKNKENADCDQEHELENKENELLPEGDGDKCFAESVPLDQQHKVHNVNMDIDTDGSSSSCQLQQIGDFEIPKSDIVHSILCVEVPCDDHIQPYVACLCSSCLKLYTLCNNRWTCVANTKLGFITRKKSGNLMYSLPDSDNVSVVLLGIKSDCTCIYLYTYTEQKWEKITLDKVYSKSIQVCPLSSRVIVVSYYTDERSYLCRYIQDISSGQWSNVQSDSTEKHITNLIPVRGIPDAVLAFTKINEIQIWNHEHGYLLTTVDISDVCPPEPICKLCFAEQGFVFVPVLNKKKGKEAGTVVVINPSMNTSESLTSITVQDTWTGCNSVGNMSDGILLCRQNNGFIRLWDVYTSGLLATIDDVTVTCFSATNQHLVAAHKHCVHLYKLNIPSLS